MKFVLDASVTLTWFLDDETTEDTDRLHMEIADGASVCSPVHWPLEVLNALIVAERRHRVSPAKVAQFLHLLERMPISIVPIPKADLPILRELARKYGLTAYDAGYLSLAIALAVPLATLDSALRAAATKAGVLLRPASVGA